MTKNTGDKGKISKTTSLIRVGSEISGAVGGAAIGFLAAGPVGVVAGAVSSVVIKETLINAGSEIQERYLGPRERVRVGAATAYATFYIAELINSGAQVREDGFFDASENGRSQADELLEGVLQKSRDSYEEKKLPHLGKLYASIAFNPGISRHYANLLIKLAGELTYIQFCLLAIASENPHPPGQLRNSPYNQGASSVTLPTNVVGVLSALYDLGQRDMVTDGSVWLGLSYITPANIRPEGPGSMLVKLMNLHSISKDDKTELIQLLS